MHTPDTWALVIAALPRGIIALGMFSVALWLAKQRPDIALPGRVLLVTGVLLGGTASLALAAMNLFTALDCLQLAHAARFLVKCLAVMALVGICVGLLSGFLRQPKLRDEELRMAGAYRIAATLCFLALIGTLKWPLPPGGVTFTSVVTQNTLIRSVTSMWGLIFVALEVGGLWLLSRNPNRARAILTSRRWLWGVLPVCVIAMSLLYAPVWLYIGWLQGAAAADWERGAHAWLAWMIIGHGLGASLLWYSAYPYVVEHAVRDQSSETA